VTPRILCHCPLLHPHLSYFVLLFTRFNTPISSPFQRLEMPPPKPVTSTQTAPPKATLKVTPTPHISMKPCIYDSIGLALALAYYLLDERPKHVKHRVKQNDHAAGGQVQIPKPPGRNAVDQRQREGIREQGQNEKSGRKGVVVEFRPPRDKREQLSRSREQVVESRKHAPDQRHREQHVCLTASQRQCAWEKMRAVGKGMYVPFFLPCYAMP
jgi:hypothetical protein